MILHTVNKSPTAHSALRDCAAIATNGDAVLLLEDGVYGVLQHAGSKALLESLAERGVALYAIQDDVTCRGLSQQVSPLVQLTDYSGFVALVASKKSVQSWY